MPSITKLVQLEVRIKELESLAEQIAALAEKQGGNEKVQPELSFKGQQWYRGARELLVQSNSSSVTEFEECYVRNVKVAGGTPIRWHSDIEKFLNSNLSPDRSFGSAALAKEAHGLFTECFMKARALVMATIEEIKSRELPVISQLSFVVSASEFETAEGLLGASKDEPIIRASGVVARVALERHLFTVADSRSIKVEVNPPHKKKAEAEDVVNSLVKHDVINAIQRDQLKSLFTIGNNCAHPKEPVKKVDVERLIREGKQLAAVIL